MQEIRNIAIIAHVDHGKTTLVDRMIYQARQAREQEKLGELILDNNDLERERGITILAKNVSVLYKGVKINVIDTPGHSDFGGEVERVLNMADGVILLVDAFEGCMPQTRFVLQKAIEMGKKPVLVINKVDKQNCRPDEVQEEVFDLMFSLGATEDQLDFRTIYGSAKQGWMSYDWKQPTEDITALLDTILEEIPAPEVVEGTPQMLISSLEYSPYVGRIAVGRVTRGTLQAGMNITLCKRYDIMQKQKIKELMIFDGLGKSKVDSVQCGDICAVVGKAYTYYSQCGIDGTAAYGYNQKMTLGQQKQVLEKGLEYGSAVGVETVPCLTPRRGDDPWLNGTNETGFRSTPEECDHTLEWVKNTIGNASKTELSKQLLMLATWDEFGEGHIMCPTVGDGFKYLDSVRRVFCKEDKHEEAVPTVNQKERVNKLVVQSRKPGLMTDVKMLGQVLERKTPEIPTTVKKFWDFTKNAENGAYETI